MNLPSKELLSEVLGCDCSNIYFEDTYNLIHYEYKYDVTWSEYMQYSKSEINIYELAFHCKEWVNIHGYSIFSYVGKDGEWFAEIPPKNWDKWNFITVFACWGDSEPEAVFKACQWILENK